MLIHAYRRTAATQVDTGRNKIDFKPNAAGDVVAEVAGDADAELLMGITEGYRVYEPKAASKQPKQTAEEIAAAAAAASAAAGAAAVAKGSAFVLKNGDDTLDLGAMKDDALKAFAKENEIRLHHTWTGDKLREKIKEAFEG
ncbi:hypothetical protein [Polaromonas sp.]|uniref:hypothetical protein n=1 Tax=Polaromonas sp. TaxID=1869339 RepID=UPI00326614B1